MAEEVGKRKTISVMPSPAGDTGDNSEKPHAPVPKEHSLVSRVFAALLYAASSFFIVLCNKLVLTNNKFPSFLVLGIGQMLMTACLLLTGRILRMTTFPRPSLEVLLQVMPLPVFYFGTVIFGLGGTKKLSLPMFIALRRFSNLFIMIGEYLVLGAVAAPIVQLSVYLMIFGALIAASNDLSFDLLGYIFIFCANFSSAASGVYSKQKLNKSNLDKNGLVFYNNLCVLFPTVLLAYCVGDIHKALEFTEWHDPQFLLQFLLSCALGFMINYSIMLCTQLNSALTTSIVGVLKNIVATYVGMFLADYQFDLVNFVGLNISAAGGVMYSYAAFILKSESSSKVSSV